MKSTIKNNILSCALQAKSRNEAEISTLKDTVCIDHYRHLTYQGEHGLVWSDALQTALKEHQVVIIPQSKEPYWLDKTIIIPSDRRIEATGAIIRLVPEYPYIMLRNEHTHDGTHAPIDKSDRDRNISIHGGSWEECGIQRGLRGYDNADGDFRGVQTCMLFNNIDHLTLSDLTFVQTTSFSLQVGDLTDGTFENFFFIGCFADGLHINGNCENLYIRNFSGHVGDDLVALNMYDWLGSSINYGPAKNIFCEEIHSAPDSHAKAMRIQPGIFLYKDGTSVDCSLQNVYIRHVSGIYEYKLYYQTPPYRIGEAPEGGGVGSADNLFFEDIKIISQRPNYPSNISGKDVFGMFFINSNIGYLSLQDIQYTCPADISLNTFLIAVGPMTWTEARWVPGYEVFDPYASCVVDTIELENITFNSKRVHDINTILKTIAFNDVNEDGFSSGSGKVQKVFLDGESVNLT